MVGEFSAAGYVDLTLTGTYWDAFDDEFAAAASGDRPHAAAAQRRLLADARLHRPHRRRGRPRAANSAGHALRLGLSRSQRRRRVQSRHGTRHRRRDARAARRQRQPAPASRRPRRPIRRRSASTNSAICSPARTACAKFSRPAGSTARTRAGSHGGAADSEAAGRVDRIFGAMLNFGDHAVEYNFGELLPGSIRGRVHADEHEDCNFDEPGNSARRRADRLARCAAATSFASTLTDANGEYAVHRPRARHLPGPRASAHGVLRRRRAHRHGRRREARRAGHVQHLHRHQHHVRPRRDSIRLLREGRRDALGQRLPRSRQRRHLRPRHGRRHRRRRA